MRRSVRCLTFEVVTTSSRSPWRIVVCRSGTNPSPPRTTKVTFAPLGRRSSKTATPCSRDSAPTVTWMTSAPISMSEVDSRSTSTECTCSVSPSRLATQGRVGPWTTVKTTTSMKTRSKIHSVSGVPTTSGTVASTTGTAPRSPAHDRKTWSRQGTLNHDTDDDGRDDLLVETPRVGEQAEQHEEADLGDPAERVGEALERHPVGQSHVAEHEGREVGGEEAGDVDRGADRIRQDGERDDADREEGGRRAGDAVQQLPTDPAHGTPDEGAPGELDRGVQHEHPPGVGRAAR